MNIKVNHYCSKCCVIKPFWSMLKDTAVLIYNKVRYDAYLNIIWSAVESNNYDDYEEVEMFNFFSQKTLVGTWCDHTAQSLRSVHKF